MSNNTFGSRLSGIYKDYKDRGIVKTQEDFSDKWGISDRSLSNYLNDSQSPSTQQMALFAKAFPEINMDWLISGLGSKIKYANEMADFITGEPNINYEHSPYIINAAVDLVKGWDMFNTNLGLMRQLISDKLAV